MTLYNYVRDRRELEALVADAVVADVKVPAPTDDWRADVHAIATAMWRRCASIPTPSRWC
ncbi:hypothetical protein I551_5898 [Mycobacterium ulcerans str. Harvey]|uniref:Uncharacterized protein n=1 Tax=Mycobacterium ulcerans str. Harvey TaxID=1299332 RepID=A0ABP3AD24_MYCUL|nr:hypothetical protein I551_5898 [Mycobacterium ulcerans str. Harvey]